MINDIAGRAELEAAGERAILARIAPWVLSAAILAAAAILWWQIGKIDALEATVAELKGKVEAIADYVLDKRAPGP